VVKLRGYLGYLPGNLSLKGIKPKRPQSKGITDLGPLGQELEQLENHQIEVNSKDFWGKVTSQRGTRSSYMTPNKNPQENALKTPPRKSQARAPKITKRGNRRDNTRP
jgi:hypothetical protein